MSLLKLALALRQARKEDRAAQSKVSAAHMKARSALYNKVAAETPGSLLEHAVLVATREAYDRAVSALEAELDAAYDAHGDGLAAALEILQTLRGELDE